MTTIGILPAAGHATRIGGIPKYLLPVNDTVLIKRHCEQMRLASATQIYIGVNSGTSVHFVSTDELFYVINSSTMTETLNVMHNHSRHGNVLFGMPDTYWTDGYVYTHLADELARGADVAVAVWKIRPEQRGKLGQCRISDAGRVQEVVDKDANSPLEYIWGALAWKPSFWWYFQSEMPHVGYALNPAITAGLDIRAVHIEGQYYDCGTPQEYFACIRALTEVVR